MPTGPVRANAPSQSEFATVQSVSASLTEVVLLAANSLRRGVVVANDKSNAGDLLIKYGAGASGTVYTQRINPGGVWQMSAELPYIGALTAVWDLASSGAARITELT